MNLSTVLIVIGLTLLLSRDCKPVVRGVDWETANKHCRSQNDFLVDIQDVRNHLSYFKEHPPIWSAAKFHFTPWIAYRGCYNGSVCGSSRKGQLLKETCHLLPNNTAGNCYFECKSKNFTYGGCANNANFFFGLQNSVCLCLCDNTKLFISESAKCNLLCGADINNGECGGIGFFSVYASMNITLTDKHLREFCLSCRSEKGSNRTLQHSIDCNEKATGYCVSSNGKLSLPQKMSTFDSYWRYCRSNNMYIVGRLDVCHLRDGTVWTGIRKYKINHPINDDEKCSTIEIQHMIITLKDRNCSENLFFLCRGDIGQKQTSVAGHIEFQSTKLILPPTVASETMPKTKNMSPAKIIDLNDLTSWRESTNGHTTNQFNSINNTMSSKSEKKSGLIAGASIAGVVVLIFVIVLTFYFLKRRQFQHIQSKKPAKQIKVLNNTTCDDLVETNQKQDVKFVNTNLENHNQGRICTIDDIYVGKENEYDHLHTSRQKHLTMHIDDDRYGCASYLEEDSYSVLRQIKNTEPYFDNEYSVHCIPSSENRPGLVNSPEYDYCYQSNKKQGLATIINA